MSLAMPGLARGLSKNVIPERQADRRYRVRNRPPMAGRLESAIADSLGVGLSSARERGSAVDVVARTRRPQRRFLAGHEYGGRHWRQAHKFRSEVACQSDAKGARVGLTS